MVVSHILYADDLMIFAEASPTSARGIRSLLEDFSWLSGLQVNDAKSHVFFGGTPINHHALQSILCMTAGSLPVSYLGLPLISRRLKLEHCQPLLSRLRRTLAEWKGWHLVFAGRAQLVQSVLTLTILHYTAVFRLPGVLNVEVECIFSWFLWNNDRIPVVGWDRCCHPHSKGAADSDK